jgi:hypothetical protein
VVARSPVAICCVVATLLLLLGLAAAAGRGAESSAPELLLASGGTLELSNSLDGAAVLTARNLKPGSAADGTVSVSNTGSVDGSLSLAQANLADTPGPFGGRLSNHVQLAVEEMSGGGSTARSVYSGALSGLGNRALGTLPAGQTRSYRFTVSLPDTGATPAPGAGDNLFQGATLRVDYVWTASGDDPASGGAGDGGAGQGSLTLELSGKRKQRPLRKRRVVVRARCSATCRLTPSARVRKARGVRRLRARRAAATAGTRKRLTFKLSRRQTRALRRALRRRRKLVALVEVTATAPGARVTAKLRITLRR